MSEPLSPQVPGALIGAPVVLADVVRACVEMPETDNLAEFGERMVQRMRANPRFLPFIPQEKSDTLFQSIAADIHVLPEDCVDPVVVCRRQLIAIAALIADMRSADCAALPFDRRIDVCRHDISPKDGARDWGREALRLMQAHIRHGDGGLALAGRAVSGNGA